ncbi:MAG: SiaC family regulatory phosphoprotein [Bacteroidia bacterium]|nr:DUF1987 domain-containing protein [Bacteroidia bacterium]MDW8015518.1 SiaC family regulatory phosphoprotein [Bacteroidia bacterium]
MRLFIEGSSYRPMILFDLEKRFLRIDGMSSMPDSSQFYMHLLNWLLTHREHIIPDTRLTFRLLYLNSGSQKALFEFFKQITTSKLPLVPLFIFTDRPDNSEEVELLTRICKQLGLKYEVSCEEKE